MASVQVSSIVQHTANSLGRSSACSRTTARSRRRGLERRNREHSRNTPGQPLTSSLQVHGDGQHAHFASKQQLLPEQQGESFLLPHPQQQQALNEARCLLHPPSQSIECSQFSVRTLPGASDFVGHFVHSHIRPCPHTLAAALLLPSALLSSLRLELAIPPSLPDGVKQVLADALLIIRAAQTETSMTSRSLASWVLQSCSRDAAALATCWVQYAHRNQADGALLSRFQDLAAQGLGLCHGHVSSSCSSSSSNSGSEVGSIPSGANRLAVPVFSSSRQQASSFLEEYPRDPQPINEGGGLNGHAPQHAAPRRSDESQQGAPLDSHTVSSNGAGGEHASSDLQEQDEEEIAAARAAEAAAIEAAAVAAAGARSSSEEPPTPSLTTTTSSSSRGAAAAGGSRVARPPLQRPLSPPPPRPKSPEAQPPDSSTAQAEPAAAGLVGLAEGINSGEGSPGMASTDRQDSMDGTGDGSNGAADLQQQLQQRQVTKVQTVPMQLIPLTPGSTLRDPFSGQLLASPVDSSSSSSRGVAVPQIGPWVLTNSARHFPSAEAEVVAPQEQQQQQQQQQHQERVVPRIALRLEHVQQRSSLGEGLLTDALGASSGSSEDEGGERADEGGKHSSDAPNQGGTQLREQAAAAASAIDSGASTAAGASMGAAAGAELLDADTDVVHAPLTLFNNSRTVRGNPGLSMVIVERQLLAGAATLLGEGDEQGPAQPQAPSTSAIGSLPSDNATATISTSSTSTSSGSGGSSIEGVAPPPAAPSSSSSSTTTQRIPLRQGARGLALQHGDIIIMGTAPDAPRFRVEVLLDPPPPLQATTALVEQALARFAPPTAPAEPAAEGSPPSSQQRQHRAGPHQKSTQPSWVSPSAAAAAAAGNPGAALAAQLQHLARQARTNLSGACAGYAALMRSNFAGAQANVYAWIAWAQAAAQLQQPCVARSLFRVAVAVAERGYEAASAAAAAASEGTASTSSDTPQGHRQQRTGRAVGFGSSSSMDEGDAPASSTRSGDSSGTGGLPVGIDAGAAATMPLVQALFTWGRFEWHVGRMWGSARHLWRSAAYACARHPGGPQAGGAGVVLHHWANAELERDNVRNARVVLAEALRKCPQDQPLYVLAAGVELAGGDPELAKEFCLRAYEMHRSDKHLYLVWPRVMAALKENDKARVLFERGLEYHPRNTKIMNAYAKFEADVGGDPNMARELHRRAMLLDTNSGTDMHNRTAFALLEAEAGRLGRARVMLTEGLSRHPRFLPGLLALAKVQRLRGEVEGAQVTLRHASKCTHFFDVDLLAERAALYRALGEDDLARSEEAHCKAAMAHKQAKKAGASTQEAWMLYERICRRPAHREAARRAYQRKVELGWLAAPGVPGPNAHRAGGPPFRPLKRTQAAEARARAEAEAAAKAAAEAEAAAAEAAEAARQQQAEAEAESAAVVEAWEEGQQQQQQQQKQQGLQLQQEHEQEQQQQQALGGDEQERGGQEDPLPLSARHRRSRSSRAVQAGAAKASSSDNSGSENSGSSDSSSGASAGSAAAAAAAAREQQEWQWGGGDGEEGGLRGTGMGRSARGGMRGRGGQLAGEESDEDMGAPLLPTGMEPEDRD